jgi:recombination protein RecR
VFEEAIQQLIGQLSRLPGIGPKGAQRIAFHLLDAPAEDVAALAEAIVVAKRTVHFCRVCFNLTEDEVCRYCRDQRRDRSQICVVEESKDVVAIERTREYQGLYHVLGGSISPIDNRGPGDLHIRELVQRLDDKAVAEIILATNPNTEGEVTATYLSRLLAPLGLVVSRLASGLPVGGDLEYADEITLGRAFAGRRAAGGQS